MRTIIVSAIAALVGLLRPSNVSACSCVSLKALGFVAEDGELPANSKGAIWMGDYRPPSRDITVFLIRPNKKPREVGYTLTEISNKTGYKMFLVSPLPDLMPGQQFRFVAANIGLFDPAGPPPLQKRTYTVSSTNVVALKQALKLIAGPVAIGPLRVKTSGRCSSEISAASQAVTFDLPPLWRPLAEQLMFETFVDGVRWQPRTNMCAETVPGRSWQGASKDLIYQKCSGEVYAAPGVAKEVVRVQIRVTAPSVDPDFHAESEYLDVKLVCRQPTPPGSPAP